MTHRILALLARAAALAFRPAAAVQSLKMAAMRLMGNAGKVSSR